MKRTEILEKVVGILNTNYLSDLPEEVSEETSFEELYLDSLDRIELSMLIDDEFKIMTDDKEWEFSKTIKDAVDIIQKHISDEEG